MWRDLLTYGPPAYVLLALASLPVAFGLCRDASRGDDIEGICDES